MLTFIDFLENFIPLNTTPLDTYRLSKMPRDLLNASIGEVCKMNGINKETIDELLDLSNKFKLLRECWHLLSFSAKQNIIYITGGI